MYKEISLTHDVHRNTWLMRLEINYGFVVTPISDAVWRIAIKNTLQPVYFLCIVIRKQGPPCCRYSFATSVTRRSNNCVQPCSPTAPDIPSTVSISTSTCEGNHGKVDLGVSCLACVNIIGVCTSYKWNNCKATCLLGLGWLFMRKILF